MTKVTKQYIEQYLASHDDENCKQFIGRALVVLFNNQTEGEKQCNDTNVENGEGFTGADAHSGCITAKYFLKHKTLLDWQVELWTKTNKRGTRRISKYWRQLNSAAQRKSARVNRTDRDWKAEFARYEDEMERQVYSDKMERDRAPVGPLGSLDFAL